MESIYEYTCMNFFSGPLYHDTWLGVSSWFPREVMYSNTQRNIVPNFSRLLTWEVEEVLMSESLSEK